MTNQTPESVIAEVIEYHADTIGSHYDGCHKHHAGCLAVRLRDMLREPGVPDAATAALERVRAAAKDWECDEDAKGLHFDLVAALDGAPEPEEKPSSTADEAALIREAKAEALEAVSTEWRKHVNASDASYVCPENWLRARAAEYREGSET